MALVHRQAHALQLLLQLLGAALAGVGEEEKALVLFIQPVHKFPHSRQQLVAVVDDAIHIAEEAFSTSQKFQLIVHRGLPPVGPPFCGPLFCQLCIIFFPPDYTICTMNWQGVFCKFIVDGGNQPTTRIFFCSRKVIKASQVSAGQAYFVSPSPKVPLPFSSSIR